MRGRRCPARSVALAEHVAFLRRLQVADGVDVAALANEDDLCVASGHLTVEVRPWDVRFE